MMEWTPTQGRYLSFIHAYTDGFGYPPAESEGGVRGFVDFVEAITNPDHDQHEEFLEWNGPFDPADFDTVETTRRMTRELPVR